MDSVENWVAKYGVDQMCRLLLAVIPAVMQLQQQAASLGMMVVSRREAVVLNNKKERDASLVRALLAGISNHALRQPLPEPPAALLLDVQEAATLMGITEAALYQRIKAKTIPGIVRTGRRVQVHRPTLEVWLARKAGR